MAFKRKPEPFTFKDFATYIPLNPIISGKVMTDLEVKEAGLELPKKVALMTTESLMTARPLSSLGWEVISGVDNAGEEEKLEGKEEYREYLRVKALFEKYDPVYQEMRRKLSLE